jgi:maltooligosyltrehalose trehalohydrolase
MTPETPELGARATPKGAHFAAFTDAGSCAVRFYDERDQALLEVPLEPLGGGYFAAELASVGHGALYRFVVGERALPDPYARALPFGVHGPAMVVESRHVWRSPRLPRPRHRHVIYELHVGTFTSEGTYRAAAERLEHLRALGITTLELMPLSAFAGERGWGYDGVAHFAPHAAYGTPDELREFVDRAHEHDLSLLIDVVYNHFGPAGNYLAAYSQRYFTSASATAWGDAPNFGEPVMRRYVLDNARYWLDEFRFDGLRLDATHALFDPSPEHVLHELSHAVGALTPKPWLVAEDERNAPELVSEHGLDAIWTDDFHHQVHVTLSGERDGYYGGYTPSAADIARAIDEGWLYSGQVFPPSGKPRGAPARGLAPENLVYCLQNHDQIGNRACGERLVTLIGQAKYRAAALLLLCLPMTPLLFMGDEWGATSPFLYFTDHEAELGALVSAGRRREFERFPAFAAGAAAQEVPDPQALATFERSKLRWEEAALGEHAATLALFRAALALRSDDTVLREPASERVTASAAGDVVMVRRSLAGSLRLVLANFGARARPLAELAAYRELAEARVLLVSTARLPSDTLEPWSSALFGGSVRAAGRGEHD